MLSSVRTSAYLTATGLLAALSLSASPAGAVPENWSDPAPVDPLEALAVYVGLPLGLFLVITFLVMVPSLVRGGRDQGPDHEWFGGPRKSLAELADPDTEESKAGGASARW